MALASDCYYQVGLLGPAVPVLNADTHRHLSCIDRELPFVVPEVMLPPDPLVLAVGTSSGSPRPRQSVLFVPKLDLGFSRQGPRKWIKCWVRLFVVLQIICFYDRRPYSVAD